MMAMKGTRPRTDRLSEALGTARRLRAKMAMGGMIGWDDDEVGLDPGDPRMDIKPMAYAGGGLVEDDEDPSGPHTALMEDPHGDGIDNLFHPDDFDEASAGDEDDLEDVHPLEKALKRRRMMARGGRC